MTATPVTGGRCRQAASGLSDDQVELQLETAPRDWQWRLIAIIMGAGPSQWRSC